MGQPPDFAAETVYAAAGEGVEPRWRLGRTLGRANSRVPAQHSWNCSCLLGPLAGDGLAFDHVMHRLGDVGSMVAMRSIFLAQNRCGCTWKGARVLHRIRKQFPKQRNVERVDFLVGLPHLQGFIRIVMTKLSSTAANCETTSAAICFSPRMRVRCELSPLTAMTRLPIFFARSPTRSRSLAMRNIATSARRSMAIGCRSAIVAMAFLRSAVAAHRPSRRRRSPAAPARCHAGSAHRSSP